MEEKKKFEKPEIRVIEFEQDVQLLAGSKLDGQLDGQLDDPDDYVLEDDPFQF